MPANLYGWAPQPTPSYSTSKEKVLLDQIDVSVFQNLLYSHRIPNADMDLIGVAVTNCRDRNQFIETLVMNMHDQQEISTISDCLDEARYQKLKEKGSR